jgi:hypothetical protein
MDLDLAGRSYAPRLPDGFEFEAWSARRLYEHAQVQYRSFRDEVDASLFPCFTRFSGCLELMTELTSRRTFFAAGTWLVKRNSDYVGGVQTVVMNSRIGVIHNVGVVELARQKGIGSALLARAIESFKSSGFARVCLEVTADNRRAIHLYRRLGFRRTKTLYRISDPAK